MSDDVVEVVELKPCDVQESKKFISEFIELYQTHACLWKYSNKDYRNKNVKDKAYTTLVDKMREVDPRADKNTVMKKINALRTGFRREYKKVRKATTEAKSLGNKCKKYTPSLWYYDILKFVVDQQDFTDPPPGSSINYWMDDPVEQSFASVDEDGEIVNHNAETLMEFLEDTPNVTDPMPEPMVKAEPPSPVSSRPSTPAPTVPTTAALTAVSAPALNLEIDAVYSEPTNTNINPNTNVNPSTSVRLEEPSNVQVSSAPLATVWKGKRPYSMVQQQEQQQHPEQEQADLDRFGVYVASKLKRSCRKQSIIAEKVIAEVLMRANLGTLEETTVLTDIKSKDVQS